MKLSDLVEYDGGFAGALEDARLRGKALRKLVARRVDSSLSRSAVAASMGCSIESVARIEGGNYDPTISELQRYARAIGCQLLIDFKDVRDGAEE